jgi:hypothetical protein
MELDSEVRDRCAIDGGINVYETVALPPERFNQWGQIGFYRPTQGENALGPEYSLQWDRRFLKGGPDGDGARLTRTHVLVIRKSDSKLLSELIVYGRGGGDVPGPWHPSSYTCPNIPGGEITLFKRTFVNASQVGK